MPTRLAVLGLALAVFVLVPAAGALACSGAQAGPAAHSLRSYARTVQCLVNAQRARSGLSPLGHDRRLARAARQFSSAMVRQRFFDHVSPQGSTVDQRAHSAGYGGGPLGETIGWGAGSRATPLDIVAGWMASPPHRAIILDAKFTRVGTGVATGSPEGGPAAATVTADFGG